MARVTQTRMEKVSWSSAWRGNYSRPGIQWSTRWVVTRTARLTPSSPWAIPTMSQSNTQQLMNNPPEPNKPSWTRNSALMSWVHNTAIFSEQATAPRLNETLSAM